MNFDKQHLLLATIQCHSNTTISLAMLNPALTFQLPSNTMISLAILAPTVPARLLQCLAVTIFVRDRSVSGVGRKACSMYERTERERERRERERERRRRGGREGGERERGEERGGERGERGRRNHQRESRRKGTVDGLTKCGWDDAYLPYGQRAREGDKVSCACTWWHG